ncbi:Major facilitator superfamily domain general substrate transporter [Penicillium mononematosum]|uniref:Major facilitator superfamily domain general substrate transporter n=1 Tax=Penicillium mononematosum TaxID=268346 RepID=UPI0025482529|nr:Major facilitator superfamily domain general substrate transporter [Penicillium mononematosum]KAJ6186857.1 Major facilitator superfamily domain general substrate transporter [Penicillium mononematosum]
MRTWYGRGRSLQVAVTSCCLVAFVLFGYDQGVFSGIIGNEDWRKQFGYPNDSEEGIIVSCYNLGCLLGCLINFCIGETLGRRRAIWLAMGVVIVGAILQTTAFNVPHLIIGRIVTGAGTGLKTSTVPMYQAEMCEGKTRGRLISSEVLFTAVGIVLAYWFDFGMSFVSGPIAWRLPVAMQMVFAIFVIVLVFGLPESPRWLMNHGQEQEAMDVLCAVYDRAPEDEFIVNEHKGIVSAIELEDSVSKQSFWKIFRNDEVKTGQRVLLAWGIQLMNQVGGINLVVYFVPTVLRTNVGLTSQLSLILGGCIQIMFMLGSLLPAFKLDSMGRRKTMMIGSLGLGICMMMVAALLSQVNEPNGKTYAEASVAFFFLYMLIHGMSINSVPWPELRETAIGVSSNWLWNFTVVMITPVIINRIQWKAYLIFMITNFLFVPVIYFYYPETSNLRLEDIDLIFARGGDPVDQARKMAAEIKAYGNIQTEQQEDDKVASSVGVERV